MERAIKILNREVEKRKSMLMQKEHFLRTNEINFELKSLNKALDLVNNWDIPDVSQQRELVCTLHSTCQYQSGFNECSYSSQCDYKKQTCG